MTLVVSEDHLEAALLARLQDQEIVLPGDEIAGKRNRRGADGTADIDAIDPGGPSVRSDVKVGIARQRGGSLDRHGLHLGNNGSAHPETDQGYLVLEMQEILLGLRRGHGDSISIHDAARDGYLLRRDVYAEDNLAIIPRNLIRYGVNHGEGSAIAAVNTRQRRELNRCTILGGGHIRI